MRVPVSSASAAPEAPSSMGGTMTIVMLGFMLGMYRHRKLNVAIVIAAIGVAALGTVLVRTQTTVEDRSYMRAMIPHHSIAILTSENSEHAGL